MVLQAPSGRAGQTIFDNTYEILAAVGRGRNSVVYKARKLLGRSEGELVALKVLLENGKDPSGNAKRMKREALAMLACRSDHVVRINDFVTHDDLCYLSMEYCSGGDLRVYLEQRGFPLPAQEALTYGIQVLSGLEAIHRAGVLHRDIKPENLLLTSDGQIKIADFGVSLLPVESISLRDAGAGVGTFDYLAPEALEQGNSDHRSDLYSVGVTLYQLLTGRLPFEADSISRHIQQKLTGWVSVNVPGIDANTFESLFKRALATNPAERFQTAVEFRQALEQLRNGQEMSRTGSQPSLESHARGAQAASSESDFGSIYSAKPAPEYQDLLVSESGEHPDPFDFGVSNSAPFGEPESRLKRPFEGAKQNGFSGRDLFRDGTEEIPQFGKLDAEENLPDMGDGGSIPRLASIETSERRRRSLKGRFIVVIGGLVVASAGAYLFLQPDAIAKFRPQFQRIVAAVRPLISSVSGGSPSKTEGSPDTEASSQLAEAPESGSSETEFAKDGASAPEKGAELGKAGGPEVAEEPEVITPSAPAPQRAPTQLAQGESREETSSQESATGDGRGMLAPDEQILPVPEGPGARVGVLEHLFSDGTDVAFSVHPLPGSAGEQGRAVVALKLYGWRPVEIALSQLLPGKEVQLSGSGIKLSLQVVESTAGGASYRGTYREIVSGRQGTWKIE